ncbi:MAG TPA: hypothetical protein VJJ80_02785 [Patescibacteria group bacterium]|nr:hypothetical protein [Patescibacteria group bacterium]
MKNLLFEFFKKYFSRQFLLTNQIVPQIQDTVLIILLAILILATIIKVAEYIWFRTKTPWQHFLNQIFSWLLTVALIGLGFWLFAKADLPFFSDFFWWLLLSLTFIVWGFIILNYGIRKFPQELFRHQNQVRKEKYLPHRQTSLLRKRVKMAKSKR